MHTDTIENMEEKHKKIEFLRDYPHTWIVKFEIPNDVKVWWNGKSKDIRRDGRRICNLDS